MLYRRLGRSDLEVSEISLGSWLTYGLGVEAEAAKACLDAAFDAGISFIDTANVYGRGAAERFLGEALRERPRNSYVLATKVCFPMGRRIRASRAHRSESSWTPPCSAFAPIMSIFINAIASTLLLRSKIPWTRSAEAVRSGKVRYIGFPNGRPTG